MMRYCITVCRILSIVYMAYYHLRRNCKLFLDNLIVSNYQIATIKCSKTRLLIA